MSEWSAIAAEERETSERRREENRVRSMEGTRKDIEDRWARENAARMRSDVRAAYAVLEREQFEVGADPERVQEIMALSRVGLADDAVTNDRQRFAGQRTLSFDGFSEYGYEPEPHPKPSYATLEEQEALEVGMKPFLDGLTMEQGDAVRTIYRYSFSFREGARRLGIKTANLQRRIKRAVNSLREALAAVVPAAIITPRQRTTLTPDEADFYLRAVVAEGSNTAGRELGPRVETTMDMTSGRLGKFDDGSDVPRRALTAAEKTWLATGTRTSWEANDIGANLFSNTRGSGLLPRPGSRYPLPVVPREETAV